VRASSGFVDKLGDLKSALCMSDALARGRVLALTPDPPPFSSMNSTRSPFERNRGCSGVV
jgi:hypothetical protein